MTEQTRRYRLRGEVGGRVQVLPLSPGRHRVGSSGENELLLPVRGVSRRHAVVCVGPEGVAVQDEGSRNGTFVGGEPVRSHVLQLGDEVRFGPVALQLEAVDAQDAELALEFACASSVDARFPTQETAAVGPEARIEARPERDGLILPEGYVTGRSPAAARLQLEMKPLARSELPVLILGETGVGKECIARILHLSSRRAGPFVAINCAAIPAELLEAEMFGIGKGVATGVVERTGKFQLAQRGTLFLDEIGDMPPPLQAKLLRALQEKEVQPVGGAPCAVDVRVLSATNSDLERRMEDGSFRRDLYYRLAGCALRVPPLRERREDIPVLVESFVRAFGREAGKAIRGVTVRALRALVDYSWPGNVRELEHELRRLAHLCPDGQPIESEMLSPPLRALLVRSPEAEASGPPPAQGLALESHVEEVERRLISEALAKSGGNRSEAARLLGISRNGLALKMERLGIRG